MNDPDFQAEIEEAGYSLSLSDAQETEEAVAETLEVYTQYEEVLTEAFSEKQ